MVTEKIKAAAHQVAAVLSGKAGILNTLEREHAEVTALMHKVLSASNPTSSAEKHYPTIRRQLLIHARAEQEVLYTACEKRPEVSTMIPSSIGEHAEVERLLGELDRTPVDSRAWMEEFRRLEQNVRHHVEQEENLLFERCQDAFENDQLRALDREYEAARKRVEDRLPNVPLKSSSSASHPPLG
jgi:hemerythrin superfamily protein